MAGDHGALTCSHLQSYDPDRALTDYISRLEALQRRLGSVTSGNTHSTLSPISVLHTHCAPQLLAFVVSFFAVSTQEISIKENFVT